MKVLDSSAMIAYLKREPGGDVVAALLQGDEAIYAHAINLVEVFYDFLGKSSPSGAEQAIADLKTDGIIERSDLDGAFWRDVASIIAARRAQAPRPDKPNQKPRLALGDACGLALSRRLDAEFVSADRAELDPIHQTELAKVLFIR